MDATTTGKPAPARRYMFAWTAKPGAQPSESMAKFLADGTALPGLTLLDSWHSINAPRGWAIVDTTDSTAVYSALAEWGTVLDVTADEILDDATVTPLIKSHVKEHAA